MIDSSAIKALTCAAGYDGKDSQEKKVLGQSKSGSTTKIHAAVNALGNPLKFNLTGDQLNDITQAQFLEFIGEFTLTDKDYNPNAFIESLNIKGSIPVVPSRKNRKYPRAYDEFLYEDRNQVECFLIK